MTASLSPSHRSMDPRKSDHRAQVSAGIGPLLAVAERPPLHLVAPEGQLQVYTAPYRGSFSAVLSQALRTAGLGSRVMVAQLLKGGVDQGPEGRVRLCGRLDWLRPAVSGCLSEPASSLEADSSVPEAVEAIWQECRDRLLAGDLDQLVLDELGLAIELGYLNEAEVLSTLEQRPGSMDVILTGSAIPSLLMAMADQVTELRRGF
ncbi:MAG: cob(I)yrinic acid a,c-diamide adenosyltransferase [Prochlorococcus sp.]